MGTRCRIKLPGEEIRRCSVVNFKKEWAEIMMQKEDDEYLEAELIELSSGKGTVKFFNWILLSVRVEYIQLLE